jgi:hypothetical protein
MRQQEQKKPSKKNGNAQPSSGGKKPARARYVSSNRAEARSIRNLMKYNNLSEAEARQVLAGGPCPSVKRQPRERKQRLQEGAAPIGERTPRVRRLMGVPLPEEALDRLMAAVEQNEEKHLLAENELGFGSSEDEVEAAVSMQQHDNVAGIDTAEACSELVSEYEREQETMGDAIIVADIVELAERSDEVFITRKDILEARQGTPVRHEDIESGSSYVDDDRDWPVNSRLHAPIGG